MKRSYEKLPSEVLRLIFEHLDQEDLGEAQLTCKRWSPIAQRLFYINVNIKDIYVNTILNMFERNPSLAKSVQWFDFGTFNMWGYDGSHNQHKNAYRRRSEQEDNKERRLSRRYNDLFTFLRLCTNVICISLPDDLPLSFFPDMIKLQEQGYLESLMEIDMEGNAKTYWAELPGYYNLLYALKNSVKKLYINNRLDPAKEENLADSSSSLVSNNISSFPQLQQLRLEMQRHAHVHEFDSILDNRCNSLIKLHIEITEHPRTHTCEDIPQQIKPMPNVKELKVSTSAAFTSQEMHYLIHKFPGLGSLSVYSGCSVAPLANASSFFHYIGQVPRVHFQGGFMLTEEDFALNIPQLLSCTKNSHLTFNRQHFLGFEDDIRDVKMSSFSTGRAKGSSSWAFSNANISIQATHPKDLLRIISAQRDCTGIRSIKFISSSGSAFRNALNGEGLATILNSFCHLTKLELQGMKLLHMENIDSVANRLNLQNLSMLECSISTDLFLCVSQRIETIERFTLSDPEWIKDNGDSIYNYQDMLNGTDSLFFELNMPFTKVGRLWLELGHHPVFVRAATTSTVKYLKYNNQRITELTYHDFDRITKEPRQFLVDLRFAAVSSITFAPGFTSYKFP